MPCKPPLTQAARTRRARRDPRLPDSESLRTPYRAGVGVPEMRCGNGPNDAVLPEMHRYASLRWPKQRGGPASDGRKGILT